MLGPEEEIQVPKPPSCSERRGRNLPLDPSEGRGHRCWLILGKEEAHTMMDDFRGNEFSIPGGIQALAGWRS